MSVAKMETIGQLKRGEAHRFNSLLTVIRFKLYATERLSKVWRRIKTRKPRRTCQA